MKKIHPALSLAAIPLFAGSAHALTLSSLSYQVGAGTNRVGVIVDVSDASKPNACLAWTVKFDGDSILADDALKAILADDHRLHALTASTSYGTALYALGYDADDSAAAFQLDYNGGDVVAYANRTNSYARGGWLSGGYWGEFIAPANATAPTSATSLSYGMGLSCDSLEPNQWLVLQFAPGFRSPALRDCVSAPSPYATSVDTSVSYTETTGMYGDFANVLGRPTTRVPAVPEWYDAGGLVSPAYAAWYKDSLLTLSSSDETRPQVVVYFDHDVVDDPRNPWGLDFTVFGNSFSSLSSGGYIDAYANPSNYVLSGSFVTEPSLVEVSADGTNWFTVDASRYCDDFHPTMGYAWSPSSPDASLFDGNLWWGAPADATLPMDPRVAASDFKGLTLAEAARRMNGSAGGTSFDISGVKGLPTDAQGRKYIRAVRISAVQVSDEEERSEDVSWSSPEVDAVADVAPRSLFDGWSRTNYTWSAQPDVSPTNVLAASGLRASTAALLGIAPTEKLSASRLAVLRKQFQICSLSFASDGSPRLTTCLPASALADIRIGVRTSLSDSAKTKELVPVYDETTGALELPSVSGDAAFFELLP